MQMNRYARPALLELEVDRLGSDMSEATRGWQSDRIRDYVFPLVEVSEPDEAGSVSLERFLGTAFFIGQQNFAMTASHVAKSERCAGALVLPDNSWLAVRVQAVEVHPEHDVAVLACNPPDDVHTWNSIVSGALDPSPYGGMPYHLHGYPDDAYYELVREGGDRRARPDLIYSAGHVRRRITGDFAIPQVSGSRLIELSSVAGGGCSGSPIFPRGVPNRSGWELAGVYVGERINDRATSVGYGVPIAEFADWEPDLVGHSIRQELHSARSIKLTDP